MKGALPSYPARYEIISDLAAIYPITWLTDMVKDTVQANINGSIDKMW
ncbi:hypothetical protein JFL43_12095 [Viridibacillus sp. YIM B01967]|uniref:Uncharacterized protein n=1 Tax=Viridibacillus soli TaxID=2798301 RepID=A0ABS1H852_9BACL|nr:hypothetical protein [Viridibacillus soli]MBK3495580.1 hypothetical protein [Viridibacillus soli]